MGKTGIFRSPLRGHVFPPWAYMLSKPSIRMHMNPKESQQDCFSNSRDTQPGKSPRSKLKRDAVHTYGRLFLTPEKTAAEIRELWRWEPQGWAWKNCALREAGVRQRKVIGYEIPSRENKDRQNKETNLQPKEGLWEFKVKQRVPETKKKNKNWRVWKDRGRILHGQEIWICNR